MSCTDSILYSNTHSIEVINKSGNSEVRNVLIRITRQLKYLEIKLRDMNDFSFNYTSNIDWGSFESMKQDQCLEINYNEFHVQLIELLKQALNKEMLLRLECSDVNCKIVFYERSRIKSLIFLVVCLNVTDQKEIIEEMSCNIAQLKEMNYGINSQISSLKRQLHEKEILFDTALTTNHHLEKGFLQEIRCIEETFTKNIIHIEGMMSTKIDTLLRKHAKLLKDVDILKRGSRFKEGLYSQTLLDLDKSRGDNLKHLHLIEDLHKEINVLNINNEQKAKILSEQEHNLASRLKEVEGLNMIISELRRDNLEATKIIAQKTKTHDEIAKDLVQANTMLVNFTNQYDVMSKEIEQLRQIVKAQEKTVEDQRLRLKETNGNFEEYKKHYNEDGMNEIRTDLFKAKARIEELEKQNREAIKINSLLTKKLASEDTLGNLLKPCKN